MFSWGVVFKSYYAFLGFVACNVKNSKQPSCSKLSSWTFRALTNANAQALLWTTWVQTCILTRSPDDSYTSESLESTAIVNWNLPFFFFFSWIWNFIYPVCYGYIKIRISWSEILKPFLFGYFHLDTCKTNHNYYLYFQILKYDRKISVPRPWHRCVHGLMTPSLCFRLDIWHLSQWILTATLCVDSFSDPVLARIFEIQAWCLSSAAARYHCALHAVGPRRILELLAVNVCPGYSRSVVLVWFCTPFPSPHI